MPTSTTVQISKTNRTKNFYLLQTRLSAPRFIPLRYPTLGNTLVRTRLSPSDEQLVDIYTSLSNHITSGHTIAGQLPLLQTQGTQTKRCNHPRCLTCRHLNCSKYVTSSKTGVTYTIRHSFSCTSSNLIYLITCTKCKKQYVGLTTKQLNVRINHHRTSILNHKQIYLSVHFNFSDHNINNLSVQVIDKVPDQCPQPLQELVRLEKFWIIGSNFFWKASGTMTTCTIDNRRVYYLCMHQWKEATPIIN